MQFVSYFVWQPFVNGFTTFYSRQDKNSNSMTHVLYTCTVFVCSKSEEKVLAWVLCLANLLLDIFFIDFYFVLLISIMYSWFLLCALDFYYVLLISIMCSWFLLCALDFYYVILISIMCSWFLLCTLDFYYCMCSWFLLCTLDFYYVLLISIMCSWFV